MSRSKLFVKPKFSFRSIFCVCLFCLLLNGCSSLWGDPPAQPDPLSTNNGPTDIQVLVGGEDFEVGTPRLPLLLFSGPDRVVDAQAVKVVAFDLEAKPAKVVWQGEAINYSDYEYPYWVVYPQLPRAAIWGIQAQITKADGSQTTGQLVVQTAEQTKAPMIGTLPPASQNRTLKTEPDLKKLTSAGKPNPNFYQMTIAEAISSGRPTVIVFATPGYCQTAMCVPVLQSSETIYPAFKEQVNFIHIEVYKEVLPEKVIDDTMVEWNLMSEPWTFVLDKTGKVAHRFGGPVSPRELEEALKGLVG